MKVYNYISMHYHSSKYFLEMSLFILSIYNKKGQSHSIIRL